MGLVSYKDTRPKQVSTRYSFSYSDLKFYINATFTKFIDWKYEKEFRFVLIFSDDIEKEIKVRESDDFRAIDATIRNRYKGLKNDESCRYEDMLKEPISDPDGESKLIKDMKAKVDQAAKEIKKDDADYKLW